MLHLCIYHAKMAVPLAEYVSARTPGHVRVTAVERVDVDPPDIDSIDAMVVFRFPEGMLTRIPKLRWLQLTCTGYEHVARAERPRDLVVTHAGSIPVRAVTEFVIMGMLFFARNVPILMAQHARREWNQPGARLIHGKTLVLVGLGRIGSEIAKAANALGMKVIAVNRSGRLRDTARDPATAQAVDQCVQTSELARVAAQADYLVVCVPGTKDTHRLVDRAVIEQLGPGCCLIDVSRPAVVDKDAVADALSAGALSGALLDVHDQEPLPPEHPLWTQPGAWITPHCAFEQDNEIAVLGQLIVDNLERYMAGRPLENLAELGAVDR